MNFKTIKKQYAKYQILEECNGFFLARDVDVEDFYLFGKDENFNRLSFPRNQRGSKTEVIENLKKCKIKTYRKLKINLFWRCHRRTRSAPL